MPKIEVSGLVSHRDGSPRVEVYLGRKGRDRVQLSVDEARDVALSLLAVAESSVQDAFIRDFVRLKLEGDEAMAVNLLREFRNMRRDRQSDDAA